MYLTQLVGISVPLTSIFALAVVVALYLWLRKQDAGTERMQEIARTGTRRMHECTNLQTL